MGNLAGDDPERHHLAKVWCARLGLGTPTQVCRVRAGRSGSAVLALRADGVEMVVKTTDDPKRLARAELEADLLRSDLLDGVAPQLLAAARGPGWVVIATRAGVPLGSAQQIDSTTWVAAAAALAGFHRRAVGTDVILPRAAQPASGPDALEPWSALGVGDEARRGAARLTTSGPSPLPLTLEHGDSHLDNILRDHHGALVWVDWQEARLGDGLSDLAFLWQRAEFAGGRPPRPEMTATYADVRGLDPADLQPLLDEAELHLLLHSWPPFLAYGTPAAREIMRRRLVALVNG